MTRTVADLEALIRRQDQLIDRLAAEANRIERDCYRIPVYQIAYGRRVKDLDVARSNLDGAVEVLGRLNQELFAALNPHLA